MTLRTAGSTRPLHHEGIVCCTVGDEQYALRGADVRQIVRVEHRHGAADREGRVGTIDVAGQTVSVFALRSVLGRAGPQARASHAGGHHIVVTADAGELAGWLVDRIVRTTLSPGADVVPLPGVVGATATTWFEGLLELGDRSMLLVSPRNLRLRPRQSVRPDTTPAFLAPSARIDRQAPSMVAIFSTCALPRSEASRYALSGRQIAAIVRSLPAVVVPGSVRYVRGVALWQRTVVPVIDFRDPGDCGHAAPQQRLVIAQCGARLRGTLVAFPVDSEITLHQPGTEDRQVAAVPRPAFAIGVFDIGGEAVALLDLDALLASEPTEAAQISA